MESDHDSRNPPVQREDLVPAQAFPDHAAQSRLITGRIKSGSHHYLVRIGYGICIFGLVLTMAGTVLLGRGTNLLATPGTILHRTGQSVMLVSLLIVLVGYRIKALSGWAQQIPSGFQNATSIDLVPRFAGPPVAKNGGQMSTNRFVAYLACMALAQLILLLFPPSVMVIGSRFVECAVFAGLLIVAVHDRGHLRSFCLSAIVPLTVHLSRTPWNWSMNLPNRINLPESVRLELVALVALNWISMIAIGILGVVLRIVLTVPATPPCRDNQRGT